LDREIRVGVPARRADGSGRRTAGRWVAPPAVAAVRFSGLRVVGRELSRARLGKAVGVPRGADDPQGPNRPGAGGFARPSPGRGSWGLSFSGSGHPHRAPTPGSATDQGETRSAASAVPGPHRLPLVLVRADPPVRTVNKSTWQSVVARRTAGSGPVVAHHASVARYGESWLAASWPGCPPYRPRGLEVLVARNLGASVCLERRGDCGCLAGSGLSCLGGHHRRSLPCSPRRPPCLLFGKSAHG
jgi:hypothetical protein